MRRARLIGEEAQVSLEMAVAIAAVLIIFWASIRLFLWVNERLVLRQEAYNSYTFYQDEKEVQEYQLPWLFLLR